VNEDAVKPEQSNKDLEVVCEVKGRRFLFAVETAGRAEDYRKYELLRNLIWEEPDDGLSGPRNMAAENYFHEGGSLFIGVYSEDAHGRFQKNRDHLVAFAYGYVGVRDKDIGYRQIDNLEFYSQYAAVRPDTEGYGLGVRLKQFQKQKVLHILGIKTIICTYDPLVGVNAYRNVHVLGMEILAYKDACYEGFSGRLNRLDVPCDRFWVSWDLEKEISRPGYDIQELVSGGCLAVSSVVREIQGRSGPVRLELVQEGDLELSSKKDPASGRKPEFALVEIPFDFYRMLQETDVSDPEVRGIPAAWRQRTRLAFHSLLERGYVIVDFCYYKHQGRVRDFYVLQQHADRQHAL
jgi:predicted GNAT superfamily acetyltransferase